MRGKGMLKKVEKINYILPAYIILVITIFILPYYSEKGYSIIKNTSSELGAQGAPNAFVMNIVFIIFGIASIISALIHLKKYRVHQLLLIIFGAGLIMGAFFRCRPIIEGVSYSAILDLMHSVFAVISFGSFILFAFFTISVGETMAERILSLFAGILSAILSALMFCVTNFAGLWQRTLFIILFAWLIFFIEKIKYLNNKFACKI